MQLFLFPPFQKDCPLFFALLFYALLFFKFERGGGLQPPYPPPPRSANEKELILKVSV